MPRPLAALLACALVTGSAWALSVPPWQSPDEQAHFAYVQTLAETGSSAAPGSARQVSGEQELAMRAVRAVGLPAHPEAKPEWDGSAYEAWRDDQATLERAAREDAGDRNPASSNPPLYYAYAAGGYLVAGGDIFDRLYAARILSVLLLLAATAGTWLLAGEVFGRRRLVQSVAAATVALHPMAAFISSSVNPDSMVLALFSVALWLGTRVLKRGATPATAIGLIAAVAAATQAKPVGWTLVPAAVFALSVGAWRRWKPATARSRRAAEVGGIAVAVGVTAAGIAALLERPLDPASTVEGADAAGPAGFLSYLWQFYLPRLPFQDELGALPDYPLYDVWVTTGWAAFGWLEVQFPEWVYGVLAGVSAVLLFGGAWAALRGRRPSVVVAVFYGLVVAVLLAGLHWTEYKIASGIEQQFLQGRYLLPLLPLGALLVAALVDRVPRPGWRAASAGLVVGGLAALQLFSLAITMARFHA
jgi:4-amino-4-deoxy-L-arabinose transferase-like glycosyltransferase